jgi:hypothetical protein
MEEIPFAKLMFNSKILFDVFNALTVSGTWLFESNLNPTRVVYS